MAKQKKARIMIRNQKGRHAQGGSESADMVLVAGAKGTGRALYTCIKAPARAGPHRGGADLNLRKEN
jgi:hypothetical protein